MKRSDIAMNPERNVRLVKLPTLEKWITDRVNACTHVLVVRNGAKPEVEAITHISQDQIDRMVIIWTAQYYQIQAERAQILQERKYEKKRAKEAHA